MSPIKGISEVLRLPLVGKIRLGTKEVRDDGTYIIPADHFICPDAVKKVFGEKPKELRIMFPTENREQQVVKLASLYGLKLQPSLSPPEVVKVSLVSAPDTKPADTIYPHLAKCPPMCPPNFEVGPGVKADTKDGADTILGTEKHHGYLPGLGMTVEQALSIWEEAEVKEENTLQVLARPGKGRPHPLLKWMEDGRMVSGSASPQT